MSRKQQMCGSVFVVALVGVITFCASNLLRADDPHEEFPIPLPVVSAQPLQVTAPQPLAVTALAPIPVTGTVTVLPSPVRWEYRVLDTNGMLGNFPPGFGNWPQEVQTAKYNAMAADGWEFVEFQNMSHLSSQSVWVWRRPIP
jgi:hypothetical protein